jgi:hypothetical protein
VTVTAARQPVIRLVVAVRPVSTIPVVRSVTSPASPVRQAAAIARTAGRAPSSNAWKAARSAALTGRGRTGSGVPGPVTAAPAGRWSRPGCSVRLSARRLLARWGGGVVGSRKLTPHPRTLSGAPGWGRAQPQPTSRLSGIPCRLEVVRPIKAAHSPRPSGTGAVKVGCTSMSCPQRGQVPHTWAETTPPSRGRTRGGSAAPPAMDPGMTTGRRWSPAPRRPCHSLSRRPAPAPPGPRPAGSTCWTPGPGQS